MSRALDVYRAQMTEDDMTASLTGAVKGRRGVWAHVRDPRGQPVEGLPDLILAVPGPLYGLRSDDDGQSAVVAMLELKRMLGTLRLSQEPWHDLISRPNVTFLGGIVRPLLTADAMGLDDVLQLLGAT